MSQLQAALDDYLAVRRALGCKLRLAGRLLQHFVDYADRQGAPYITSELASAWATLPAAAQPAQWANRLGMVRRFAMPLEPMTPHLTLTIGISVKVRRRHPGGTDRRDACATRHRRRLRHRVTCHLE